MHTPHSEYTPCHRNRRVVSSVKETALSGTTTNIARDLALVFTIHVSIPNNSTSSERH